MQSALGNQEDSRLVALERYDISMINLKNDFKDLSLAKIVHFFQNSMDIAEKSHKKVHSRHENLGWTVLFKEKMRSRLSYFPKNSLIVF